MKLPTVERDRLVGRLQQRAARLGITNRESKAMHTLGIKGLSLCIGLALASTANAGTEDVYTRSFTYDELGRLIAEHGANGQLVTYTYDTNDNLTSVTDGEDRSTLYSYDALNRVRSTTNALNQTTTFAYDAAGRVKSVTDPKSNTTSYTVDGFGQMWRQVSPDTGTTTFAYDAAGRRTSMTRADGTVTTYTHDGLGRVTTETAEGETQSYVYDSCPNGRGRLCKTVDAGNRGSLSYAYSPEGWLLSQTQVLGTSSIDFSLGYDYDNLGRLTRIDYPNAVSAHYTYEQGQLSAMSATIGGTTHSVLSDMKHRPFGGVSSWIYGNGLTRAYSYDLDGRLLGLSTKYGASIRQSLTFGYNDADEIIGITNASDPSLSQQFAYDGASRLTSVVASGANQNFSYDANGNRISHTWDGVTDGYSVASSSNRLQAVTGSRGRSFTLDANGNVVASGSTAFTYNGFNRLSRVDKDGVATHYWVNALGQRTYKSQGSPLATGYVYGPNGLLSAEFNWNGSGWSHYLRLPSGEPIGLVRNGQLNTVHTDHLGRPEVVINSSRSAVWRSENFAFGRTVTLDSIGGFHLGFPGQYFDAESSIWHNGFRDYDSTTGRYLQSDPIGLSGGSNTYLYAMGNPVRYTDPTGLIVPLIIAGRCAVGLASGYLAVDGTKAAMQDFKNMQENRKSATGSNCPGDSEDTSDRNAALAQAVGVVQDAFSAFASQGAAAQWRLASMGTASFAIGLPPCSAAGAGLGAAFGEGGASRALDGFMRGAANWMEDHK